MFVFGHKLPMFVWTQTSICGHTNFQCFVWSQNVQCLFGHVFFGTQTSNVFLHTNSLSCLQHTSNVLWGTNLQCFVWGILLDTSFQCTNFKCCLLIVCWRKLPINFFILVHKVQTSIVFWCTQSSNAFFRGTTFHFWGHKLLFFGEGAQT